LTSSPDSRELLKSATTNAEARGELLDRYRDRLKRMVAVRLDPRLAPRIDPSDVVQDALAEADAKLDRYLLDRPLPFYPWLRQIAWERVVHLHRRHIGARRRSVGREEGISLSDRSAAELAERLFAHGSSPSQKMLRDELRAKVRAAIDSLADTDREVLVLRHLEQLSVAETAEVLGVSVGTVKMRHVRALARLRALWDDRSEGKQ
jgi:RNA polymerase sigma-70 factor (ECF subfamily)